MCNVGEFMKRIWLSVVGSIMLIIGIVLSIISIKNIHDISNNNKNTNSVNTNEPQIIIETSVKKTNNGIEDYHNTDESMGFLSKIGIIIIPILFVASISLAEDLGKEYNSTIDKFNSNTYTSNEINLMAIRYYMMSKYIPTSISVPSTKITIFSDKTYKYSSSSSNIIIRYQYTTNLYDEFKLRIDRKIKIIYTNDIANIDNLSKLKRIPLEIGFNISYNIYETNIYNPIHIGYGINLIDKLYFVPGVQVDFQDPSFDIYLGLQYNIYGMNIGLCASIVKPSVGLSVGFFPTYIH